MRKRVDINEPHSPIVYSTADPVDPILKSYFQWWIGLKELQSPRVEINRAWLKFYDECDKLNKNAIAVARRIIEES